MTNNNRKQGAKHMFWMALVSLFILFDESFKGTLNYSARESLHALRKDGK